MENNSYLRNRYPGADKRNPAAILSLIFGTICIFITKGGWALTLFLGILSVVFGCLGLRTAKKTETSKIPSICGLIIGGIGTALSLLLAYYALFIIPKAG